MTHVIYHRADYDGLLSAAVCLHFMPDAVLHGWDYGDPVPVIPEDCKELYIVDLSVPELMDDPRLVWIDHHKTAIDKWDMSEADASYHGVTYWERPGVRVDGVAACRLCWQWFWCRTYAGDKTRYTCREVAEPLVLTLAGEYDVWNLSDPQALPLQHGLATFSHDPRELGWLFSDEMSADLDQPADLGTLRTRGLIKKGAAIEEFLQKEAAKVLAERSYTRHWEGLNFLVLNTAKGNSRSFPGTKEREDIDALMMWRFDGSKVLFSLYHKEGREDLDLSVIAAKYGGGGHRGACGFPLPLADAAGVFADVGRTASAPSVTAEVRAVEVEAQK